MFEHRQNKLNYKNNQNDQTSPYLEWLLLLGRKWPLSPVFLPEKSHGQRSLVGYSPWGCKESDVPEWLSWAGQTSTRNQIVSSGLWLETLNKYNHYPYFKIKNGKLRDVEKFAQVYKEVVSNSTSTICVLVYFITVISVIPMPHFPHL